jgi:Iron-sulfur cluster-binding domain
MSVTALIPTDTQTSRLGLRARLGDRFGDVTVLGHTVCRAASIPRVEKIVLLHPPGQDPLSLIDTGSIDKPVTTHMDPGCLTDAHTARRVAARKWAQPNWRGGLGGATCYDELLPPGPLADALEANGGEAAYIVRGDWCLFDPGYAQRQLDLLFEDVQAMKMIFTQAPPGLSGIAVGLEVLQQLRDGAAGFGDILAYNPKTPQIDPVGRDVNCPIPATVRDCTERFIYDTPRCVALIGDIAQHLGGALSSADAAAVTDACRAVQANDPGMAYRWLPRMVTLELTPRREATGPITPQHHVTFDRPDMDSDLAIRIVEQLGEEGSGGGVDSGGAGRKSGGGGGDVTLLLGGLGDAMLHPRWDDIVLAAHGAGVFSVGIETELLCGRDELAKLLELPLDLVKIRFNADTAETYHKTMGTDGFKTVLDNIQWLYNERLRRVEDPANHPGARALMPWLMPSMVKTVDTLPEMESFFDKWTHYLGHALIAQACDGCGLMPAMSPVPMQPPDRQPCRQVAKRMSILSDGTAALCDQDWLGRAPIGDTRTHPLIDIWRGSQEITRAHAEQRWEELTICSECAEWHRP